MIGSTSAGFSNLVIAGERIENCLKSGKIRSVAGSSNGEKKPYAGFAKKKEGETNNTSVASRRGRTYQPAQYRQLYAHPHQ